MPPELLALLQQLAARRDATATRTPSLPRGGNLFTEPRAAARDVTGLGMQSGAEAFTRSGRPVPQSVLRVDREEAARGPGAVDYILRHKLVPTSMEELRDALGAMASFDKERLAKSEGTLLPELLVGLMPGPGEAQAARDVVMDVKADDVTPWGTGLAALGMLPVFGMALRTGRRITRAAETAARELSRAARIAEEAGLPIETRKLYHFSDAPLETVDPTRAGTGPLKGAERAREGRQPAGHFYTDPSKKETGLGDVLHETEVEGAWYDTSQQIAPELDAAITKRIEDAGSTRIYDQERRRDVMEEILKERGYVGMADEQRGIVTSFHEVPIQEVGALSNTARRPTVEVGENYVAANDLFRRIGILDEFKVVDNMRMDRHVQDAVMQKLGNKAEQWLPINFPEGYGKNWHTPEGRRKLITERYLRKTVGGLDANERNSFLRQTLEDAGYSDPVKKLSPAALQSETQQAARSISDEFFESPRTGQLQDPGAQRVNVPARVIQRHTAGGGSTVHARTGKEPTTGFGVSTFKDRERTLKQAPTEADIQKYIDNNADLLDADDNFMGTWHNKETGEHVLDVSRVFDNQADALRAGRAAKQDMIWDFATKQEIPVPEWGTALQKKGAQQ